jgi:hypothetical protein
MFYPYTCKLFLSEALLPRSAQRKNNFLKINTKKTLQFCQGLQLDGTTMYFNSLQL